MAAERARGTVPSLLEGEARLALIDIWFRGDTAGGLATLEAAMRATRLAAMPAPERPYLDIADVYSLAGRPDRARTMVTEFDRLSGLAGYPELAARRQATLGGIAIAERRYVEAIVALRAADTGPCVACPLPVLGLAYDLAGNADSTIAVFERYLASRSTHRIYLDPWFLAGIHKRLGELYDARDDPERAAEHYTHFIGLWNEADPELQPKVQTVRRRLIELRPVERASTRSE